MRITPILITLATTASTVLLTAGPAAATPPCPDAKPARLVATIPGAVLESLAVDNHGRLYASDAGSANVYRISRPGTPARSVARVPEGSPGGLAWSPDGTLLVGYAPMTVIVGDALRPGGIARFNTTTRTLRPWVTGLSASNGVAASSRGTVYTTNDFGNDISRVSTNGRVNAAWGNLPSANGAAVGKGDRYLYVARTFANPGVSRISTSNPRHVVNLLNAGLEDAPDGLTLDSRDRPIVTFNLSGKVVRIDAPGRACVLASGLPLTSTVAYGQSENGFSAGRLFSAGFDGKIYEIPGGFDRAAQAGTHEPAES